MSALPPITMSVHDWNAIDRLIESNRNRGIPGLEALRRELDRADVLEAADMPSNVVTMNSVVRFGDGQSGHAYELRLVYPHDANEPGTVSILAPIGSALLGLAVGQSISWPLPGRGTTELRVLGITYQPEAASRTEPAPN